jgi:hypothetical protein
MGIFNTPLGMGVNHDPINISPFNISVSPGEGFPPIGSEFITTEAGVLITTESAVDIITE